MKNVQVIDEAINASYDIYSFTDEEFSLIFPGQNQDIEFIEDVVDRIGDENVGKIMHPIWKRKIEKKQINGIHGTLFYGLIEKKKFYENKREPVINWKLVD